MMKKYIYILLSFAITLISACNTEVDLCYSEHPHHTETKIAFDWQVLGDSLAQPDSMMVFADRIVNKWKCGMTASSSNDTASYAIRQGEYKMMVLNRCDSTYNYETLDSVANSDSTRWNLDKMALNYVAYSKDSKPIKKVLQSWTDYNVYASFAQNSSKQVFVDIQDIVKIDSGSNNKVVFTPERLTQKVVMQFPVKKLITDTKTFRIDSMFVEVAGIPTVIYPYDNTVNVTKTCKMLTKALLINATTLNTGDEYSNENLLCRIDVDVNGIIYGTSENEASGPGILQVILFTTASGQDGKIQHRRIEGKINIFHSIHDAHLLDYEYGTEFATQATKYAFININATLVLDSKNIVRDSDGNWGIPSWIPCETQVVVPME